MRAPKCSTVGSVCDTASLLNGRGTMAGGQEPNRPNTIDGCEDGSDGNYQDDESIDRIVVRTVDGGDFNGGALVSVDATIHAWGDGSDDYADFYYTTDVANPNWVKINMDSLKPQMGGVQTLSAKYFLPHGFGTQAVRVVFKYSSTSSAASPCPGGSWTDVDDVVFSVSMNGVVSEPDHAEG